MDRGVRLMRGHGKRFQFLYREGQCGANNITGKDVLSESSVLWKAYFLFHPRSLVNQVSGIPRLPTVSQHPMTLIVTSQASLCFSFSQSGSILFPWYRSQMPANHLPDISCLRIPNSLIIPARLRQVKLPREKPKRKISSPTE